MEFDAKHEGFMCSLLDALFEQQSTIYELFFGLPFAKIGEAISVLEDSIKLALQRHQPIFGCFELIVCHAQSPHICSAIRVATVLETACLRIR